MGTRSPARIPDLNGLSVLILGSERPRHRSAIATGLLSILLSGNRVWRPVLRSLLLAGEKAVDREEKHERQPDEAEEGDGDDDVDHGEGLESQESLNPARWIPFCPLLPSDRGCLPMDPVSGPTVSVRVVDVYPYRVDGARCEWLLLRRATGRAYAGQWRMVGGKINPGETAWQAALRELAEETGYAVGAGLLAAWALPSVNTFYDWQRDAVSLTPAFAAEVTGDPQLDAEHDAFEWLSADEAASRLGWPEQRRLLTLASTLAPSETRPIELAIPLDAAPVASSTDDAG